MDKLRDFMQGWQGKAVLVLTLVPMALMGVQNFGGGHGVSPSDAVKVGNATVSMDTYRSELNQYRTQLLGSVDASLINDSALADEVLQAMVDRALLQNQSHFLGMTVSDETITRLLQLDPSFHDANGQFSNDLFANYLQSRGMTKNMLFETFRSQLSLRQLTTSVVRTAIYPDMQIGRLLDLQSKSREIWVHRYHWHDFAGKVSVSDQDIQDYYNSHKDTLINPARVDLAVIELTLADVKTDAPTEDEIKAQYQSYLQSIGQSDGRELAQILLTGDDAKARAEEIKAKLDKGESFVELAKKHSDDPTGESGGNIGVYNPEVFGDDAKVVGQALEGLGVGQSSQVVKTQFGYHIFNVVKMADVPSLESMRATLTEQATEYKRQNTLSEMIFKINGMAEDGMGISDIAKAMDLTAHTLKDYPQTGNQTPLSMPSVISAAFDEFSIADQSVSPAITLTDKTLWVQPSNYRASAPMTLAEATEDIKQTLTKQRAVKLAFDEAMSVASTAKENPKPLQIESAHVGVATITHPLLTAEERASLFATASDGTDVWAVQTDNGASVVVGLPIVSVSQAQLDDQERAKTASVIRDNVGQDQFEDYLQYLRDVKQKDIVINKEAIN